MRGNGGDALTSPAALISTRRRTRSSFICSKRTSLTRYTATRGLYMTLAPGKARLSAGHTSMLVPRSCRRTRTGFCGSSRSIVVRLMHSVIRLDRIAHLRRTKTPPAVWPAVPVLLFPSCRTLSMARGMYTERNVNGRDFSPSRTGTIECPILHSNPLVPRRISGYRFLLLLNIV